MQFAVPQFTDVEDKLIGPLTLKQFMLALGFGAIIFLFWSILGNGVIFFIVAVPTAALGAYVTFKKFNGRPFFAYLLPLISFLLSPRFMIFTREQATTNFTSKEVLKPIKKIETNVQEESTESRLKKLSYLLDRKLEQEQEIIEEVKVVDRNSAPAAGSPQSKILQAIQMNKQKAQQLPPQELPKQSPAKSLSASSSPSPTYSPPKPPKKKGFDPNDITNHILNR